MIALLIFAFASISSSQAAETKAKVASAAADRDFVAACTGAFAQSAGNDEGGVGKQVCDCTAKEAHHEGVSRAALQKETAFIQADPKHQIGDQKLLNAFHYCTIQLLQGAGS